MDTYQGPATLLAEDGTELGSVTANLIKYQEGNLGTWRGTCRTVEAEHIDPAFDHNMVIIQLPSGETGSAIPNKQFLGTGEFQLAGSGPAPF